jgi:DHA1 family tetracycline resistance protein-like MFS transporter
MPYAVGAGLVFLALVIVVARVRPTPSAKPSEA